MMADPPQSGASRFRILVITHEPLRENLSGPGIRALEIARTLAIRHSVTVATPLPPKDASDHGCAFAEYSFDRPESLKAVAEQAEILIVQGVTLSRFPLLATLRAPIVADLYCPFTVEHLEMITSRPGLMEALAKSKVDADGGLNLDALEADVSGILAAQTALLALGDFFICASERQRDFWIGALHTAGRINLRTYAQDRTLRSLIDVVPFGLPDQPFPAGPDRAATPAERAVLKGVRAGIDASDHVLLWAGSILDWQDPQTLVQAVASIARRRSDVKLFFMGTRHPNPQVPAMRAVADTIALAERLGVRDRFVFFNDWVPYAERWRYLAEADLGLSTHRDHLETRLSFRTRMLDYIWAGLPIVCTEGDVFASLVAERGLGRVVPPGDAAGLAAAIEQLLDDDHERGRCRERLLKTAEESRWHQVVGPLARYCDAPRFAADRAATPRALPLWLIHSYRLTNWLRRVALALGVSRAGVQQAKGYKIVRAVMAWRNRLLLARARGDVTKR
jgi:glycosyltransferase involved in cell wall biosynthesis